VPRVPFAIAAAALLSVLVAAPAVAAPATTDRLAQRTAKVWQLRSALSSGSATRRFAFGLAGDAPVMGDWNGDGRGTVGVFRDGTWFLRDANSPGPSTRITFGTAPGADALAWSIPKPSRAGCSAAYPTVCIPPPPPGLDCPDVLPRKRFKALAPDPHRFDADKDGVGCE
jgi:hypothetical protein